MEFTKMKPLDADVLDLLTTQCMIAGKWCEAAEEKHFCVSNPLTREVVARVPDTGAVDADLCVSVAQKAFPSWASAPAGTRASVLRKWAHLIRKHHEALAKIMTLECGKPIAESRAEVTYAVSFVEWFAGEALRVYGETIPSPSTDRRIVVHKKPIGVAAMITPWNFPCAMITRKAAAALAVGCTVVIKPSEEAPLSALALAKLAYLAEMPDGVMNVITAQKGDVIGKSWCDNPAVRKLSFTGSSLVGKKLYAQSADTVKKLSLELGGNAPFIVFEDADIDLCVDGAMQSKFRNAGQTCVCVNRFIVHEAVKDAFEQKLKTRIMALVTGDPFVSQTHIGPLINQAAVQKVHAHVADALEKGARLLCGAKTLKDNLYAPTLLDGMNEHMKIAQEETFGPVAAIFSFTEEKEALRLANSTQAGLAAFFYTKDYARVHRVSEGLEFGIIGVNTGITSTEVAPFGGMKQSGLGREGSHHGIDDYLELQYVCLAGL